MLGRGQVILHCGQAETLARHIRVSQMEGLG